MLLTNHIVVTVLMKSLHIAPDVMLVLLVTIMLVIMMMVTPYCDECYNEEDDPDCPNNPDVDEVDRTHIINLSRNWLKGEIETKRPIYINNKDYLLKTIREKVGIGRSIPYMYLVLKIKMSI